MKKVAGTHGVRSSDFFHTHLIIFSRNSSSYKILVLCVSLLKIGLLANFLALFPSKAFLELYPILFLLKNGHVTKSRKGPINSDNS